MWEASPERRRRRRTPVCQLDDLARPARGEIFFEHRDLSAGYGLPGRGWFPINVIGCVLLEAGIVRWVSDLRTRREVLRLGQDWLRRLEEAGPPARRRDGRRGPERPTGRGRAADLRAAKGRGTLQRKRHARKSEAFQRHDDHRVCPNHANVTSADGHAEELRPVNEPEDLAADGHVPTQGMIIVHWLGREDTPESSGSGGPPL